MYKSPKDKFETALALLTPNQKEKFEKSIGLGVFAYSGLLDVLKDFTSSKKVKQKIQDIIDEKEVESNYYADQLKVLKPDETYSQSVVIHDGQGNQTKFLALNEESIPVMIEFLKKEAKRIKKLKKAA